MFDKRLQMETEEMCRDEQSFCLLGGAGSCCYTSNTFLILISTVQVLSQYKRV